MIRRIDRRARTDAIRQHCAVRTSKGIVMATSETMKASGIHGVLNVVGVRKLVRTCSYGEQQRVAIIRALQQPFDFLLMDEPFSNLDDANRKKAMELIEEEVSKRNASIILADLKRLDFFAADRIVYL